MLGMTIPLFPYSHCHAELAEASLCTFITFFFIVLRDTFAMRCNASPLLFGKSIACIAIRVGVAMGLQMFRPYGAGDGVRCSLIVIRCS